MALGGLEDLGRDLLYATRSLRRDRGFALTAILSLALGIGVNTTVFSMADGFLFSQPSGRNAESMVRARVGGRSMVGMREFRFLRDVGVFQDLVGFDENLQVNWRSGDASQRLFGVRVTGNFFEVTRVPVALGHPMQPRDREVVIVSHRFWINHFQGAASALGRVMVLDGLPHTLIGVLPPNHKTLIGLAFAPDVYLPVTSETGSAGLYGRPPQGQSLSAFKEKLRAACERLDQVYPDADHKWITDIRVTYLTGIQRFTEGNKALMSFAAFFLMLMVIVGLLVIIACTNVAGLLLARAAGRAREFAIRSSIGASRGRLIRQLLAESLLLSLLGAAAGLGLNLVLTRALSGILLPLPVPIVLEMAPGWKLLAYLALIAVVSAVTVGLLPALTSTRSLASGTPKGQGASLRKALVTGQLAVSVIVLVTAALFMRNLLRSANMDPGFDLEHTTWAQMRLVPESYRAPEKKRALIRTALEQLRALPEVESASLTNVVPLNDSSNDSGPVSSDVKPEPLRLPLRHLCRGRGLLQDDGHSDPGRPGLSGIGRCRQPASGDSQ